MRWEFNRAGSVEVAAALATERKKLTGRSHTP
jgi:hypothetical protein